MMVGIASMQGLAVSLRTHFRTPKGSHPYSIKVARPAHDALAGPFFSNRERESDPAAAKTAAATASSEMSSEQRESDEERDADPSSGVIILWLFLLLPPRFVCLSTDGSIGLDPQPFLDYRLPLRGPWKQLAGPPGRVLLRCLYRCERVVSSALPGLKLLLVRSTPRSMGLGAEQDEAVQSTPQHTTRVTYTLLHTHPTIHRCVHQRAQGPGPVAAASASVLAPCGRRPDHRDRDPPEAGGTYGRV